MRFLILIFSGIFFGGCDSKKIKYSEPINLCFSYPAQIDSLNVTDLYDSARWFVYAWQCNKYYKPKDDTSRLITFGELPLKFNGVVSRNDTLELNFDFIDKTKPILPSMTQDYKQVLTGVGFDLKTRKKIYMGNMNWFLVKEEGVNSRYKNSLQPEVVKYIKNKWDKLDSCFKSLAQLKGINGNSNESQ